MAYHENDSFEILKAENIRLRAELDAWKSKHAAFTITDVVKQETWPSGTPRQLHNEEIARYSRQLILPEIGLPGN